MGNYWAIKPLRLWVYTVPGFSSLTPSHQTQPWPPVSVSLRLLEASEPQNMPGSNLGYSSFNPGLATNRGFWLCSHLASPNVLTLATLADLAFTSGQSFHFLTTRPSYVIIISVSGLTQLMTPMV